jgi:hypothetical protein
LGSFGFAIGAPIPGGRVAGEQRKPAQLASARMLLKAPPRTESFVESMIGDVDIAVTRSAGTLPTTL